MKVVLIQPPVQDFYETDVRLQPIGLCYLKAAVETHVPEVEVVIKDYHLGYRRRTIPLPQELAYLSEYYPSPDQSPFAAFHQYYHFGQTYEAIETEVAALQPDVVGISALFTPYYREALEVAARLKARLHVPIVMGGAHVSAVPQSVLEHACVDYVIRGEGERPFVALMGALLGRQAISDVPNLGYKQAGQCRFNPMQDNGAIDDLPFPAVGEAARSCYVLGGKPLTFMITSRSCPHRCSFCSVHTTFGLTYRRRQLDQVLDEIELRYRQGYRVIDFEDDNLTFYKSQFKELCRRLRERFPPGALDFVAMNGISYLSLDDELLELMREAGFSQLNLALVSSDKTVRETTKRPHTIASYLKVVHKAFDLGFRMVSYQILGLPQERLESMVQTLAFNAALPVLLGASPFYRTPESPIARGLDLDETDFVRARLTAMAIETPSCTREDIYTLFVITRMINFLKGLEVGEDADLDVLVARSWPHRRTEIGMTLLRRLAHANTLFFWTRCGLIPNAKFKPALFFRVLQEAGRITCQNNRHIDVANYLRSWVKSSNAGESH